MRARHIVTLAAAFLFLLAAPQGARAAADPGSFMAGVSGQVLQLLNDKQHSDSERAQQFAALVDESFDMARIARFVLGPNWRSASDEERQQFTQAFRVYMIQVYWSRFSQYSGQSFNVTGQQPQSANLTLVSSTIIQPSGPPVKVNWVVTKEGDDYKITDVSIDGISQVLTYRQEFAAVIARNNGQIGALIDELNKKIKS